MTKSAAYDSVFYDRIDLTSYSSAQVVVPHIMELIAPSSVIDVGCGRGVWLAEFVGRGVSIVRGLDAKMVDQSRLAIDQSEFRVVDLSQPFTLEGQYDLAVCLEVAEHLPGYMASHLVQQLTTASPVVLFSAAVPFQGGTRHINEQWHCYWHEIFSKCGFACFDILRPKLFNERRVAGWFRQNMFVYAKQESHIYSRIKEIYGTANPELVPISPHVLSQLSSVTGIVGALGPAIRRAIANRFVRAKAYRDFKKVGK